MLNSSSNHYLKFLECELRFNWLIFMGVLDFDNGFLNVELLELLMIISLYIGT